MNPDCANCGTALVGEYCHACGQRVHDGDELTVGHALRAAASDLGNFESKTLRSMALLFRPGWLTRAYLSGRRAAFTSPIKLYFVCAAITFLLAPFTGLSLEELIARDPYGTLAGLINAEIQASGLHPQVFHERFNGRFQQVYTTTISLSIVGGAAMLALLFRGQRRPFGAHVVYELHYVSFLYLATIVLAAIVMVVPRHPALGGVLTLVWLAPYQFFALRRVYAERGFRLVLKTAALMLFGILFDSAINFLALWITVKSI